VRCRARLGSDGHLLLYEPDVRQRQVLKQNLSANDVTNATVMRRPLDDGTAAGLNEPETIDDLRLGRLDLLKINGRPTPRRCCRAQPIRCGERGRRFVSRLTTQPR
jgi:hypothetical protein